LKKEERGGVVDWEEKKGGKKILSIESIVNWEVLLSEASTSMRPGREAIAG